MRREKVSSMQYRQGDVLLETTDSIPEDAHHVPRERGKIILAHGEATGHTHAIAARQAQLLQRAGVMYLLLHTYARLRHQEHDEIRLPPGRYIVRRQREYTPEEIRNVAD